MNAQYTTPTMSTMYKRKEITKGEDTVLFEVYKVQTQDVRNKSRQDWYRMHCAKKDHQSGCLP